VRVVAEGFLFGLDSEPRPAAAAVRGVPPHGLQHSGGVHRQVPDVPPDAQGAAAVPRDKPEELFAAALRERGPLDRRGLPEENLQGVQHNDLQQLHAELREAAAGAELADHGHPVQSQRPLYLLLL